MASRSRSEYTATVGMPSSRHVRMTRTAISPRLAIRTLENIGAVASQNAVAAWRFIGFATIDSTNTWVMDQARTGGARRPRGGGRRADRGPGPAGPDLDRAARRIAADERSAAPVGLPMDRLHLATAAVAMAGADARRADRRGRVRPEVAQRLAGRRPQAGGCSHRGRRATPTVSRRGRHRHQLHLARRTARRDRRRRHRGQSCGGPARPPRRRARRAARAPRTNASTRAGTPSRASTAVACATVGREVRVELADDTFTGWPPRVEDDGALVVDHRRRPPPRRRRRRRPPSLISDCTPTGFAPIGGAEPACGFRAEIGGADSVEVGEPGLRVGGVGGAGDGAGALGEFHDADDFADGLAPRVWSR